MNKGFTLIELLAVIVVLSVIALITFLSVNTILTDSKESLSKTQKTSVENAAKTYYLKEGMQIDAACINVSDLISKGYIESTEVIDPKTEKELTGSVKITYDANHYNYQYQDTLCE